MEIIDKFKMKYLWVFIIFWMCRMEGCVFKYVFIIRNDFIFKIRLIISKINVLVSRKFYCRLKKGNGLNGIFKWIFDVVVK